MGKLKQNPEELGRIVKNHLVRGVVRSADLADDLVGPSAALTKLRSNIYEAEDGNWREVKVGLVKYSCVRYRECCPRCSLLTGPWSPRGTWWWGRGWCMWWTGCSSLPQWGTWSRHYRLVIHTLSCRGH